MTEKLYVKVVVTQMKHGQTDQTTAEGYIEINDRKVAWDANVNQKMVRFAFGQLEYPKMEKVLRDKVLTTIGQVNIPAVRTFVVPR